jgi:hypothetical protein
MDLAIAKLVAFSLFMQSNEGVLAKSPEEIELSFREINSARKFDYLRGNLPSPIGEGLDNYLNVWGPVSEPALEGTERPLTIKVSDPAAEDPGLTKLKEHLNVPHHDNTERQSDPRQDN